jgi:hypothetical protein
MGFPKFPIVPKKPVLVSPVSKKLLIDRCMD